MKITTPIIQEGKSDVTGRVWTREVIEQLNQQIAGKYVFEGAQDFLEGLDMKKWAGTVVSSQVVGQDPCRIEAVIELSQDTRSGKLLSEAVKSGAKFRFAPSGTGYLDDSGAIKDFNLTSVDFIRDP